MSSSALDRDLEVVMAPTPFKRVVLEDHATFWLGSVCIEGVFLSPLVCLLNILTLGQQSFRMALKILALIYVLPQACIDGSRLARPSC